MKIYKLPYIMSAYVDISKKELKKLMKSEKARNNLAYLAEDVINNKQRKQNELL